ncbi:amino acid adenylation domain-containing protein [Neorhizobium huautlense]|uniref:Amino acid adenylation domain-containing protein n=1 Tax=Neorhizobium huautlense TaxID=67774 RepID=A0ABT9PN90_9HYPH|nr:amino acid adenylation domain-containing protein [Neorhizobium huautlense]MDP9835686.1 amino acid adenylation domain-containing protein [Neorhizobium huautlense]
MSLSALLDELEQTGIQLWVENGQLRFRAPAGAMTAPLKAKLTQQKQALLARLSETPAEPAIDAHRFEPFPQTPIQQAYLVGRTGALDLGGVSANSYLEFECPDLDTTRADACLAEVISRHDMLRTVLLPDGLQVAMQRVPDYHVPVSDISGLDTAQQTARLAELRKNISERVRDPFTWPLFELHWVRTNEKLLLLSCVDLIALDAWSSQLFHREWFALIDGEQLPPAPGIRFRDCVVAEENDRHRDEAWSYWRRELPLLPPAPHLPASRASGQPGRFHRLSGHIDKSRWQALKAACKDRGVTPTSLIATVFANTLSLWSRNEDVTLNMTLFNRPAQHEDMRRVLGEFTNTTLVGFAGMERPLGEQVQQTQSSLLERLENSAVSGVDLLRELARLKKDYSGSLMPVVFTSLLIGEEAASDDDRRWKQIAGISQTPQVSLDHQLFEENGGLSFNWDAAEATLDLDAVKAAFERYVQILTSLCDDATSWGRPLTRLLPEAQKAVRDAIHVPPTTALDASLDITAGFWNGLAANAKRDALLWSDGRMSHGELAARASTLSERLKNAGVQAGDRVFVRLPKGPLQVVAVLAVLHAGAIYVPVAPDLPTARVEAMRAQVTPVADIVEAGLGGEDHHKHIAVSLTDPISDISPDSRFRPRSSDTAYIIFTSGSTGVPKGVAMSHGAVANTLDDMAARFGMAASDRVFALSSLSFDLSVYDVFAPLSHGAAIVIPDPGQERNPAHWHSMLETHRATIWNSVPMLLDMALVWCASMKVTPPTSLRLALVSGDWVPLDLPARLASAAPQTRLVALGGATEAAVWSNWQDAGKIEPQWKSVPYGKPLTNQYFRVLDRYGADRPDRVAGQLYIGGHGLADGYWGDCQKTAAAFITTTDSGERLYKTGDLGCFWENGTLEFLGRDDGQVKVGGHRIELGDITHALQSHTGVARAVAITQETSGGRQIIAHIATAGDTAPTEETLRQHCRSLLPTYMVPARIGIHASLPLSANGKIDIRALPAITERRPVSTPIRSSRVRTVFERVLGRRGLPADINFFELGATSIRLVEAHAALRNELGIDLQVTDLFMHTTIAALEAHVAGLQASTETNSEKVH